MIKTRIYSLLLTLLLIPLSLQSQITFRTQELKRLATTLKVDTAVLFEGYNQVVSKGTPLTIHVKENVVDHIGRQMFPEDIRTADRTPIFDFLERYFLQLQYPPVVKSASNMIRDDQFQFLKGNLKTAASILPTDAFDYAYDHSRYTATWSRDGIALLSVSFPAEYQLISGENKIEAELHLQADIQNATVAYDSLTAKSSYSEYINGEFTNRLYFSNGQLLISDAHPAETTANIMLCQQAPGDYMLNIKQVLYGFNKQEFLVPLRQWIAFCQHSGCKLYYGIEDISENGDIRAVVLAVNEAENYNHVLTVDIPADIISEQQGVIPSHLYSYVPTHNVRSLFATFKKSNKKTFVKQ